MTILLGPRNRAAAILSVLGLLAFPVTAGAQTAPRATYRVYVGAESADMLHVVRYGPEGATVERSIRVGESSVEMEGPHGLQISRDGRTLHFTTGHGAPDGKYWRMATGVDSLLAPGLFLGKFPASLDVTPDGLYAFVANFNLHGSMTPSSISVVYTPTSTEVARVTTCTMPHGSRVSSDGLRQYSTCMMDDQLVELDATQFGVARRFSLVTGKEGPLAADWTSHAEHGVAMAPATCSPTWAQPSVDGRKIYVACNKSDVILEIDRTAWRITRRFPTGRGPYNLAVTPDGKLLVATLKQGGSVQVFSLTSGQSVFVGKSSTTLSHGIVISPDSRYAFVTSEGVGAQPGRVDIWDLTGTNGTPVAGVDVAQQASGIAFWRMDPPQ